MCGDVYLPGYINVNMEIPDVSYLAEERPDLRDANVGIFPDRYYNRAYKDAIHNKRAVVCDIYDDVRKLEKFPADSVNEIVCVQGIEHLSYSDATAALIRWHKLLKDTGKLYLTVPDMPAVAEMYVKAVKYGYEDDIKWCYNEIYGTQRGAGDFHLSGYDRDLIRDTLTIAGYGTINFLHSFHDYPALFVEAMK